jgi:hypothetical protein
MSISPTKFIFILFFSMFSCSVFSQSIAQEDTAEESKLSMVNSGVKGSLGIAYNSVNPSGKKYVGLAYEGKGGFAITYKLFVYDGFFVGGAIGSSYFENTNPTLTGNYDKTRVGSNYLFLGYQYHPIEKLSLGISSSVVGESRYKNEYKGGNDAYQVDKAKLRAFEANLDYYIAPNFSINLYYIYRNDKTNIRTSPNLQSTFNRAQFSIIGLGLNFQFGKDAIISSFKVKK